MRLIIVSGLSGSGKTVCLRLLEDWGFYCIDNLPLTLLPLLAQSVDESYKNIAVSIDVRNIPADLDSFDAIVSKLKKTYHSVETLFFDASNETLLKRFSETRRKHPLTDDHTSLSEAITQERSLLNSIIDVADLHVDTSRLNVHELRDYLLERVTHTPQKLSILLQSFGFKYGVPADVDYVFDIRCLPNPHWVPGLDNYTGTDQVVMDFLEKQPAVAQMFADIKQYLERWLPAFEISSRRYMTIAIGCTGGQHRSVYMIERLAECLREQRDKIQVHHRELS